MGMTTKNLTRLCEVLVEEASIKTTFNYILAKRHFDTRKAALYASNSAALRIKKRRNWLATTAHLQRNYGVVEAWLRRGWNVTTAWLKHSWCTPTALLGMTDGTLGVHRGWVSIRLSGSRHAQEWFPSCSRPAPMLIKTGTMVPPPWRSVGKM